MDEPDLELERKLMIRAAEVLREIGMPTAAKTVDVYSRLQNARKYMDLAIEAGIAGERERIAMEYEAKRQADLFRLRLEYKLALSLVGTSGMTTQGYRTFWG